MNIQPPEHMCLHRTEPLRSHGALHHREVRGTNTRRGCAAGEYKPSVSTNSCILKCQEVFQPVFRSSVGAGGDLSDLLQDHRNDRPTSYHPFSLYNEPDYTSLVFSLSTVYFSLTSLSLSLFKVVRVDQ